MAVLERVRVGLTGFNGGPGVMTFYASNGPDLLAPLKTFLEGLEPGLPSEMILFIENTGDRISDVNGVLTGGWSGDVQLGVTGNDTAAYPSPCGACVTWVSDGIPHGYRLKGRTYLVPLGGGSYDGEGQVNTTNRDNIQDAADAFIAATAGNLKVWNRPRKARAADGSRRAVTQRDGSSYDVISANVSTKVAVLTSRRD